MTPTLTLTRGQADYIAWIIEESHLCDADPDPRAVEAHGWLSHHCTVPAHLAAFIRGEAQYRHDFNLPVAENPYGNEYPDSNERAKARRILNRMGA